MQKEELMYHVKTDVISDTRQALNAVIALHDYYESLCILRLDSNTLTSQHLQNKNALLAIISELKSMYKE